MKGKPIPTFTPWTHVIIKKVAKWNIGLKFSKEIKKANKTNKILYKGSFIVGPMGRNTDFQKDVLKHYAAASPNA